MVPVLSRVLEWIVIHDYLYPALTHHSLLEKTAGLTTASLIALLDHLTAMLRDNEYIHVFLVSIDCSKAFDMVRHRTLLDKMTVLDLPDNIQLDCAIFQPKRTCHKPQGF